MYTEILQKPVEQVVATDLSDEILAAAGKKKGHLKNAEFQKADALHLSFEDAVFMASQIPVVGHAEEVNLESKRVLKKEGCLIINAFVIDDMSIFNRMTMGIRFFNTFGKSPVVETGESAHPISRYVCRK